VILLYGSLALLATITTLFSILALRVAQARRASRKRNCYYCGNVALHVSSPGGLADRMLTYWNCIPHQCEVCFRRQYRLASQAEDEDL
jgi:hypothetical protein